MSSVLVVGDALMDNQYYIEKLPEAGQDIKIIDFRKNAGGSAANAAIALASCGLKTYFCAGVGDDMDGRAFIDNFQKNNVDTSLVQQKGTTGFTVTMIDKSGERTMLSYRDAAANPMQVTSALAGRIKEASMVLVSGYMLIEPKQAAFVIAVSTAVKESGGKVALDPSPVIANVHKSVLRDMLALTDVLLPNEDELGTIVKKVGEIDVPCVAVKLGSRGAKMIYDVGEYSQAAKDVDAIDTTGAGDAFNAGFIASMLGGDQPFKWLKNGIESAAEAVSQKGAV